MSNEYTGIEELEILEQAKNYNSYLISLIEKQIPSHTRKVLDFGAGTGSFSKILKEKGYDIDCIEVDPTLKQKLESHGFRVFSDISETNDNYDFIFSLNVLEHIENDKEALEQIIDKLTDKGKVFIYLPAFNFLYTAFDKKVGHFRRYDKSMVKDLINGLSVTKGQIKYCDVVGFFAAMVFKFISGHKDTFSLFALKVFDKYCFPFNKIFDPLLSFFVGKNVYFTLRKN